MAGLIARFDVFWIDLEPTRGAEIRKTRPGVIVSPDEMNRALKTVIVAPLTSTRRSYPTRVATIVNDVHGDIALDQIRAIDRSRLLRRVARLDKSAQDDVVRVLLTMFG